MKGWMSVVVAVFVATGCAGGTDPTSDGAAPETTSGVPSASTFAGTWRSTTPSLEFIRLTVSSKSSEVGVLAARLTFSGVAWEGSGRIEGDSFVADMAFIGTTTPSGKLVAQAPNAESLRVQLRSEAGGVTDLTFVREN